MMVWWWELLVQIYMINDEQSGLQKVHTTIFTSNFNPTHFFYQEMFGITTLACSPNSLCNTILGYNCKLMWLIGY